jgi:hypothetical protein
MRWMRWIFEKGIAMTEAVQDPRAFFDLGHQKDIDYPQLLITLRLTPTDRLDRHEGWRLFAKEALSRARLHQSDDHKP